MAAGEGTSPSLLGISADELQELMRQLLPKMELTIQAVEPQESGATFTCTGATVLATTGLVTPEALQPLTLADARGICMSTGGFTEDARAYSAEFGVRLYDAQDLAALVAEHGIWEPKRAPVPALERFLPSVGTLEALMDQAARAFAKGDLEEAASLYRQATNLKPHYALAWALRGVCAHRLEEPEEALSHFVRALEISIEDPDVWFYFASLLYDLDRHEEELQAYDQAVRLRPDLAEAWVNKGATLHELERYEEALDWYDEAVKACGKDPRILANRGAALLRLERHDEALRALEAAVRADPGAADAVQNLGLALQRLGRHEEALPRFEAVLAKHPEQAPLWTAKGHSFNELRDREAVACFEKALELDPEYGPAKTGLRRAKRLKLKTRAPRRPPPPDFLGEARQALAEGDLEEAAAAFAQATDARPEDPEAWYERGMTLALTEDYEGALAAFTEAVNRSGEELRYRLSRMNVLVQLERFEEALEDSNAALKAGAKGLEMWLRRGEIFQGLGMHREAAQCFQEALDEDDSLPRVWSAHGRALAAAGDNQEAQESLERALQMDPTLKEATEALEALEALGEPPREDAMEFLRTVPRLGKEKAEALVAAGFETLEKLRAADENQLCAVKGIGPATAKTILAHLEEARG